MTEPIKLQLLQEDTECPGLSALSSSASPTVQPEIMLASPPAALSIIEAVRVIVSEQGYLMVGTATYWPELSVGFVAYELTTNGIKKYYPVRITGPASREEYIAQSRRLDILMKTSVTDLSVTLRIYRAIPLELDGPDS